MVEMARSNRKRPLRILCDDWNRCWPSMSQDWRSSEILRSDIHLADMFARECDFYWSRRPPFSAYTLQYPCVGPL
jgi:hypothetical protein